MAERTIYSNPAIAALMNQWFVNIKVDREERPDLDQPYMLARQVLTGAGGWPNDLFLTPDLKPFFAGSYFPPEDQGDTNGFPTILKLIHADWEKSPAKIKAIGDQVQAALSRRTIPVESLSASSRSCPLSGWQRRAISSSANVTKSTAASMGGRCSTTMSS